MNNKRYYFLKHNEPIIYPTNIKIVHFNSPKKSRRSRMSKKKYYYYIHYRGKNKDGLSCMGGASLYRDSKIDSWEKIQGVKEIIEEKYDKSDLLIVNFKLLRERIVKESCEPGLKKRIGKIIFYLLFYLVLILAATGSFALRWNFKMTLPCLLISVLGMVCGICTVEIYNFIKWLCCGKKTLN